MSGELLRTIGFAATPGLLRVLAVITPIAIPVFALSAVWMLAAMVVPSGRRWTTQTSRAVAVCVLGWVLAVTSGLVLGLFFGPALS